MFKFLIIILFVINSLFSTAHPWKPQYFVIIDTDASIDDLYTLNILLNHTGVRVLAITVSNGATPATIGYQKVKSMLTETHHEGILVGINKQTVNQNIQPDAVSFSWSNEEYPGFIEHSAESVLKRILNYNTEPLTFINLASLHTLNLFLTLNAETNTQINEVLWNIEEPVSNAYNYNLAPNSYHELSENALEIGFHKNIIELFSGENSYQEKFQVFREFPADALNYTSDIAPQAQSTQKKFGAREWAACIITNELHRHIGIYAIIGAKMGIRALEYFGAGADELQISSYAGANPPVSCLNDGIQVSTGATLGHGLIKIIKTDNPEPTMVFTYLGQKLSITLKPEYQKQIQRDLKQLSAVHGINSDVYWDLVREIALNCWFNWDRNEIFELKYNTNP
ncbi:MAG: FmdE family protein [Salinivirgaceae bacterium]